MTRIFTLLTILIVSVNFTFASNAFPINLEKATIKITGVAHSNSRTLDLKAEQILLLHEYINHDRALLKTVQKTNNHYNNPTKCDNQFISQKQRFKSSTTFCRT